MRIGILGAGLSGLSLAHFLQKKPGVRRIEILEKEHEAGGLCRSFFIRGVPFDIGPHIIFSKDEESREFILARLAGNLSRLRRSNKILYKGRLVKYPFENELSALPEADRRCCLDSFLHNPYEGYRPATMLQFFLATFGEGITNCYLRPYNEKIWKFDPAFMDTQMVDRIPKPPREDIIKSAEGAATEGYTHQLYFHYPRAGGIGSLPKALLRGLGPKAEVLTGAAAARVSRVRGGWRVVDSRGVERRYDRLISTIPLPELALAMSPRLPAAVDDAIGGLKYNSIIICVMRFPKDCIGDNFALMVPDRDALFHRVSKLDFLMPARRGRAQASTLMAEITFRDGGSVSGMSDAAIRSRVNADLIRAGCVPKGARPLACEIRRFTYAYVIYDLNHRRNLGIIRAHLEGRMGLTLCGRFGEFEYLNMDAVVHNAKLKAEAVAAQRAPR